MGSRVGWYDTIWHSKAYHKHYPITGTYTKLYTIPYYLATHTTMYYVVINKGLHPPPSATELFQLTFLISCIMASKLQSTFSSPSIVLPREAKRWMGWPRLLLAITVHRSSMVMLLGRPYMERDNTLLSEHAYLHTHTYRHGMMFHFIKYGLFTS